MRKLPDLDAKLLEDAVKRCFNINAVAREVGRDYYATKRQIVALEIDTAHFNPNPANKVIGKVFGRLTVLSEKLPKIGGIILICLCECGIIKEVSKGNLTNGTTNSCGCLSKEKSKENIKKSHQARVKYIPADLSSQRVWERGYHNGDLTLEDFRVMSQLDCWYCKAPPANVANWYKGDKRSSQARIDQANYIYNGLDRIDNTRGHDKDNLVPCCFPCNVARMKMTQQEFGFHIARMFHFRSEKYAGSYIDILPPTLLNVSAPSLHKRTSSNSTIVEPGAIFGALTVIEQVESVVVSSGKRKAYLCLCGCGRYKNITGYDLRCGTSTTCGKSCICKKKFLPEISTARKIWSQSGYKSEGLLFDNFYELSKMLCSYCDSPPSNSTTYTDGGEFIYNGIDRLDSTKTHTLDNVVPSCWDCNRMKRRQTIQEFDAWLTRIYNHFVLIKENV